MGMGDAVCCRRRLGLTDPAGCGDATLERFEALVSADPMHRAVQRLRCTRAGCGHIPHRRRRPSLWGALSRRVCRQPPAPQPPFGQVTYQSSWKRPAWVEAVRQTGHWATCPGLRSRLRHPASHMTISTNGRGKLPANPCWVWGGRRHFDNPLPHRSVLANAPDLLRGGRCFLNPSLSFGTTSANGIMDLERYGGVYGTTFV